MPGLKPRGAQQTAGTVADLGQQSFTIALDVRPWESVRSSTAEIRSWAERVDAAVNVPGINRRKPVLELDLEEFSEVLNVNL